MIQITVNGRDHHVDQELTIAKLLASLNVALAGTAIALNETIVPRERHGEHILRTGDRVEIVRAIGGG